jgi:hypothetical protein
MSDAVFQAVDPELSAVFKPLIQSSQKSTGEKPQSKLLIADRMVLDGLG